MIIIIFLSLLSILPSEIISKVENNFKKINSIYILATKITEDIFGNEVINKEEYHFKIPNFYRIKRTIYLKDIVKSFDIICDGEKIFISNYYPDLSPLKIKLNELPFKNRVNHLLIPLYGINPLALAPPSIYNYEIKNFSKDIVEIEGTSQLTDYPPKIIIKADKFKFLPHSFIMQEHNNSSELKIIYTLFKKFSGIELPTRIVSEFNVGDKKVKGITIIEKIKINTRFDDGIFNVP